MENGLRVPSAEKRAITAASDCVFVSYQPSAYKDERTELRILNGIWKVHTDAVKREPKDEFLLIQDGLSSHQCDSALKYV
jgi:hypothetical protein